MTSETVWDNGVGQGATGGGVSSTFAQPSWQSYAGVPNRLDGTSGRGVPDVAGDADPQTGYQVLVDGHNMVIGGTSAVAPLWAALTARLVQSLGRPLGLLQPALYGGVAAGVVQPGFRDITAGNNGQFHAGPGGIPAPAWVSRTGPRCWPPCRAGNLKSGSCDGDRPPNLLRRRIGCWQPRSFPSRSGIGDRTRFLVWGRLIALTTAFVSGVSMAFQRGSKVNCAGPVRRSTG